VAGGLTNVLWVECSDHQQQRPGLPVKRGDGKAWGLVPRKQCVHSTGSAALSSGKRTGHTQGSDDMTDDHGLTK
jgi:hypothetical protein